MELLASLALLYFLPTLAALARGRSCSAIVEVALWNLLLGWTLIGWIIAMMMATERRGCGER